jgi:HEAT repeat protein
MPNLELTDLVRDPLAHLDNADPAVRRLAVSCCVPNLEAPGVGDALMVVLAGDADPRVRAEAAEALGGWGERAVDALEAATGDSEAIVREAVATAMGELRHSGAVTWLLDAASGDDDSMVREAAVAALGAIGDPRTTPVLLELVRSGPPQVRRRAVVALTVFDGDDVEAAIRAAAQDRNPMVREAAEMVVGRASPGAGPGRA